MFGKFLDFPQIIRGEMPEGLVNHTVWKKPKFRLKLEGFLASIG